MSDRPLFSILHPSARPHLWSAIHEAWVQTATHPGSVEYILCADLRWGFTATDLLLEDAVKVVWNEGRRCYVDAVNTAARASAGRILIVIADDQWPCEAWDEKLVESVWLPVPVDHEFVAEVSTGTPREHERGILVMPILSRSRFERLGYVFFPQYESMYADNDFCEHARQDGIVIDATHLLFPHRHPINTPALEVDKVYRAQNREDAYRLGEVILAWRRRVKFGEEIESADSIREGGTSKAELESISCWASQMETVVEIGSWAGRSARAMAKGTAGRVICVDTWRGSADEPDMLAMVEHRGGSMLPIFQENTADCLNIAAYVGDSVTAAAELPDADMVFIDGGHSYDQVKADLLAWLPKTRKLICGHDYQADTAGVIRAVHEVLGEVERGPGRLWYRVLGGAQLETARPAAKRSIALCLPGEHFERRWVAGLVRLYGHLISKYDYAIWDIFAHTSNVYATREEIREAILTLNPKPDLLLWLDDDNILSPDQFDLLLADLEAAPEVDGVTGWCWIHDEDKQRFLVSCGEWAPDHLHWQAFSSLSFPKEMRPRPVEVTGFPCFLMRYSAIEKAGGAPFVPILDPRLRHVMTGEDLAFCLRAEQGGARFLVDPRVRVPHLKTVEVNPVFLDEGASDPVRFAVMIRAKNEARWIRRCVESVQDLAEGQVYVLDDESTDTTALEAAGAGAHVIPDPFAGEPLDERRDKNWLLDYVVEHCNPDWILCIDGDEQLEPGGAEKIRQAIAARPAADAFALRFLNFWDHVSTIRVDGVYGTMVRQSLFRPVPGMRFESIYEKGSGGDLVHVLPFHAGLHTSNAPIALEAVPINVCLLHYGYLFREDRLRKYEWYNRIDPSNTLEDGYRHMVQGDVPEVPADARLKHAGPLDLRQLPARMVPKFEAMPGPFEAEESSTVVVP